MCRYTYKTGADGVVIYFIKRFSRRVRFENKSRSKEQTTITANNLAVRCSCTRRDNTVGVCAYNIIPIIINVYFPYCGIVIIGLAPATTF